jgi:hypothetical protein
MSEQFNPFRKSSRRDVGFERARQKLNKWSKGEPITARRLSRMVEAINRSGGIAGAQQIPPERAVAPATNTSIQLVRIVQTDLGDPARYDWVTATGVSGTSGEVFAIWKPTTLRPSRAISIELVESIDYVWAEMRRVTYRPFTGALTTRTEDQAVQPSYAPGLDLLVAFDVRDVPTPPFPHDRVGVDLNIDARQWVATVTLENIFDIPDNVPVALPGIFVGTR